MKIEIETKFDEGDSVYHKSDTEESLLLVTGHLIQGKNSFVETSGMEGIRYFREFELDRIQERNKKVKGFSKE